MIIASTTAHKALMVDLKSALGMHEYLGADEMLAVVSQLVGNLVALQDQRRYTPDTVMELVANNIEIGNQVAIESSLGSPKGAA